MKKNQVLSLLFTPLLFCATTLYAQWTEHRTPVGKQVFSLGFIGDQVFAQWRFPGTQAFGSATAQNNGAWEALVVPTDTLCPGNLCKPKAIVSENGHLYYVNPEWPGFIYKSDDAGQSWTNPFPPASDFSEVLFVGDYIFTSVSNMVWRNNSDGLESFNSFSSASNWNIADLCQWDDKLLLLDGEGLWVSSDTGDTWAQLTAVVNATGVSFKDADLFAFGETIFLSIRDQGLQTSTDGGTTWTLIPFPGGQYVHAMVEYNGKLFCGDGKSLFSSTDNGMTWAIEMAAPGPNVLQAKDNALWIGADCGVFKSTDDGKNWFAQNIGLQSPLSGFAPIGPTRNKALFSYAGRLFLSTEFGLFDTPDDGDTWRYAGNFSDITAGMAGDSALVIKEEMQLGYFWHYSRDTGQTWLVFPLPPNVSGNYKLLLYASGAYYAFANTSCYKTSNFGQDWEQLPVAFPGAIWQAAFSQGKLFAVAHNGYAISEDLGLTWTIEPLAGIPDFQLFFNDQQIYARFLSFYYRYDTDHWQEIPVLPLGNYTLVVGEQALFAYDVISQFTHNLLLSVDEGENWINLIYAQPFLTNRNFDLGALAFGMHQNNFYAFGKSAIDGVTPALWKLNTGETGNPIRPGKVFFDQNGNGIPDGTDKGIPNIVVSTPSMQAISNAGGEFVLFSGNLGDTLRPYLNNPSWISDPPFHILSATPQPYFFAITLLPGVPDLVVTATAAAAFRPGATIRVKIRVMNTGAVNATGVLRFVKPAAIDATPDFPPANVISGDTLIWNIDLLPFFNYDFNVLLEIPDNISIGALLPFFVEAIPDIPDAFPSDNTVSFTETVVGSFDPNKKSVDPERISTEVAAEGTWLDYTIRFQNTGTDYAFLVRLTDTLSERLDLRSIQIRSASHACQYAFREGRVLEATFSPVALSPTLANEPGSHGFLRFAIRLLPGLEEADTVRNTAHIVFDYNAPVRTNTAKTWIEVVSAIRSLPGSLRQLTLFPNPASTVCNIGTPPELSLKNAQLYVMDSAGRILRSLPFATELEVSDLAAGVYFVVVRTEDGAMAIGSLVIK